MLKSPHHIFASRESAAASAGKRVALLLAGGDGTRLQELTRQIAGAPIPKQYCPLLHGSSLLEATIARARLFTSRDRISAIINQDHLDLAKPQLQDIDERNIFVQPLNRDTGPGMLFALTQLQRLYHDPIVAAFPTDHYVDNDRAFIAHVNRAADAIARMPDKIAVLGIAPDRPETGYGYILPARPLDTSEGTYHVEAFAEKPSLPGARDFISRGGLWNTFVMVFRLSRMMRLLRGIVPDAVRKMSVLRRKPEEAAEVYREITPWNLSTRVLARIPQHLIMLEIGDVQWSDWGTRESIEQTYRSLNLAPFWNISTAVAEPLHG